MDWARLPSLSALRAFEAAARLGSFTKAARELNVTHAAVAQHVRALEAEFSENLMVRQGRGLALTPSGAQLAQALQNGFSLIEDGVEQLHSNRKNRPISISVSPGFADNWLMPRIGDFWAEHPEILVNISATSDIVDLFKDEIDLAIRHGDGHWPPLESELLTYGDYWVVAHRNLVGDRVLDCIPDAADLPWVFSRYLVERRRIVERAGLEHANLDVKLFNTNELVLSALFAGLGVSVQPRSLVERDVNSGNLVKICALEQMNIGYYIVTVPNRQDRRLKEFRNWLLKQAEGQR